MSDFDERDHAEHPAGPVRTTGGEAIKWSAIVVIVVAILYFLARFVIPLLA